MQALNEKSPASGQLAKGTSEIEQPDYTIFPHAVADLTTAAQRARVLDYLQNNRALTTLEARHLLNVMHPAGRVQELRRHGYNIITNWRRDADSQGRVHRVGEYVLLAGGEV